MKFLIGPCDFCMEVAKDGYRIFNFSSFGANAGVQLNLIPPMTVWRATEYQFDCAYAEWLMTNDDKFVEMMNVVMECYNQNNVYLSVTLYDDWCVTVIESFLKFIQQRYGICGTFVSCMTDIEEANDSDFAPYGIMNLDNDKERWSYLQESYRIAMGGRPEGDEYV